MSLFTLFHHALSFAQPDPLGDGLAEEIAAEQAEPEAIVLEDTDPSSLIDQWDHVVSDIKKDPEWFTFAQDE